MTPRVTVADRVTADVTLTCDRRPEVDHRGSRALLHARHDRRRHRRTAGVREQAIASMPTGRFTTPEEVATLVALLASPRSGNVTGSNVIIDGGLIKTM